MENKKPIYLFMHLPKTAGTSMRNLLERNYDRDQLLYVYQEPPGVSLDTIKAYDKNRLDKVRVVYGHFPFGIHKLVDDYPIQYITMLRDPVQRVISTYYHYKRVSGVNGAEVLSKKMGISEFVFNGKFLEADNAMVRLISGVDPFPFGQCSHEIYKVALDNINKYFSDVLILERMDESLARLKKLLDIDDVMISRDNVNKQLGRRSIRDDTMNQIQELNKYDVMLYKYILRRFKTKSINDETLV